MMQTAGTIDERQLCWKNFEGNLDPKSLLPATKNELEEGKDMCVKIARN